MTRFNRVKLVKKQQLCDLIWKREHVVLAPHFLFDVQVKRLHEYKRQLLNALNIIGLYLDLKDDPNRDVQPITFLFGAKGRPATRWQSASSSFCVC